MYKYNYLYYYVFTLNLKFNKTPQHGQTLNFLDFIYYLTLFLILAAEPLRRSNLVEFLTPSFISFKAFSALSSRKLVATVSNISSTFCPFLALVSRYNTLGLSEINRFIICSVTYLSSSRSHLLPIKKNGNDSGSSGIAFFNNSDFHSAILLKDSRLVRSKTSIQASAPR